MIEVIKSEIYRLKVNRCYTVLAISMPVFLLIFFLIIKCILGTNSFGLYYRSFIAIMKYMIPIKVLFNINLYEEYRLKTLKNACVMNSRQDIYIGKLVVQLIVNMMTFVGEIIVFILYSYFATDRMINQYETKTYIVVFLMSILIIIHNVVLVDFLMLVIRSEMVFMGAYIFIFNFLVLIMDRFEILRGIEEKILLSNQFLYMQKLNYTKFDFLITGAIGIAEILGYVMLGSEIFKKQEIK